MGSMCKIDQSLMPFLAQRAIGAGFGSVLFTDVRNIEDVRDCVRAARPDHPNYGGLYGVATRRNSYMGYGGTPEYVESVGDTVLAFMIEKKGAVDNLEEILEEPGVEMTQWGGADYSVSIGRPREMNHPQVVAAKKKTFEMSLKMGVPTRAEIQTADEAKEYLDIGVRHFSVGTDISILHSLAQRGRGDSESPAGRVERRTPTGRLKTSGEEGLGRESSRVSGEPGVA